jgi:hypothetical protein
MPNESDASKGFTPFVPLFRIRDRWQTDMEISGETGETGLAWGKIRLFVFQQEK